MQARRFRLLSIEMPGFDVDEDAVTAINIHAPERGGPRLGLVLANHCAALESLDLSITGITTWREIRTGLRSCPALQRVNLAGSVFTRGNNPFNGLAECRALRELVLDDTDIGRVLVQLEPVLRACRALTKLSLNGNRLRYMEINQGGPPVCVLRHLTNALMHHPSLQDLDLTGCELSAECITLLAAALPTIPRLERLVLAQNDLTVRRVAQLGAMMVQCPSMRHLDVRENPDVGNAGLEALVASQGLRGLASLDVSHLRIDCIGPRGRAGVTGAQVPFLRELALCPRMQVLNLSYNNLGDTFVRALARMLEPSCRLSPGTGLTSTSSGSTPMMAMKNLYMTSSKRIAWTRMSSGGTVRSRWLMAAGVRHQRRMR
jgi:Leucine-rich repeat (LRR) protein